MLFHSFLPPQPYGTQFHAVHTSPVQLVSLPLPHKGRGNKAPSSKSKISVLPQGVDILCFFTPFYPLSHTARSFTRSYFAGSTSVPSPPPRRWEGIKPPPRNHRFRSSRKGWTFCAFSLLFTPSAIRHAVSLGSYFAGSTSVPSPPHVGWSE